MNSDGSPALNSRTTSEIEMTLHLSTEAAVALAMVMNDPGIDLMLKRHAAELLVEDLIGFLDDTEADCDLEPSLGFSVAGDDREGGDIQDEPHDELDEDGRDVSWPEVGPHVMKGFWQNEDDEDTHDAEQTNEDGGNVTDEPHDAMDEGNDEYSLSGHQPDGPSGWGAISYEEKQAINAEVRGLLSKVSHRCLVRPEQWLTGPDGRLYRFVS